MIAEVRLWGNVVGHLSFNRDRKTSLFQVNPDFPAQKLDIAPVLMPLNSADILKTHTFIPDSEDNFRTYKGLPEFIADSLPDSFGNRVINAWLTAQGRNTADFTPIERLCYTGKRGVGALEYYPLIGGIDRIEDINVDNLVKLADNVLDSRKELDTNLSKGDEALMAIVRVGTSAGGARPKAVIAYNPNTGQIKSGQIAEIPAGFQHWLIKLDGVTKSEELGLSSGMGRVEYAYHLMAKDCGINMTECMILEENDRAHFMTKRFDRTETNDKIFMQSLNAIARMNYNQLNTHYYEQLFSVIRKMRLSHTAIEQQFRRMVFNIVAVNCDDHTKNIAFLMDKKGNWSLSPAYDMTYAYDPTGLWNRQHFLGIRGKFENFTRDDLIQTGIAERIKNREQIIEQACDVVSRWDEYAQKAGVDKTLYTKIGAVHQTHVGMKNIVSISKNGFSENEIKEELKKAGIKFSELSAVNRAKLLSGKETNELEIIFDGSKQNATLALKRNNDSSVSLVVKPVQTEQKERNGLKH